MKLICFLIAIVLFGCSASYKVTNKKYAIVLPNYSKDDFIIIKNYVLCNNLRRGNPLFGNKEVYIDADSVFKLFLSGFEKLDLISYVDSINSNHCTYTFHENYFLNPKKISYSELKNIIGDTPNQTILLPIIYIDNIYEREHFESFTNIEIVKNPFFKILVYIIKGEDVIYRKSCYYQAKSLVTYDKYDPQTNVSQGNIDTLVAKVMEDYIKRLK